MNTIVRTTLTGIGAGVLATVVKGQAEGFLQPAAEKLLPPSAVQKDRTGGDPADHPAQMPPAELADRAMQVASGKHLDDDQRQQISQGLHWAMGLGAALAYAGAVQKLPVLRNGRGLLAGGLLFATTHGSGLPLAGLQASPADLPRAWWIWEGGSHLIYGVALDLGVSLLDKTLPA